MEDSPHIFELLISARGVRSLIFAVLLYFCLLCFKNWLLLLSWLLRPAYTKFSTPAPIIDYPCVSSLFSLEKTRGDQHPEQE